MNQDKIATMFRAQELQRRTARQKIIVNHIALADEELTSKERAIDEKAKERLQEVTRALEKSITPGYWQRLWAAIRGR